MPHLKRRYAKDPKVDKSLRHSLRDGVAYSVMTGAGETYFSAFALFLKATNQQIGLLASLPPLIGSLVQLLSAWVGRRTGLRKPLIMMGGSLQAAALVPLVVLPLLFPDYAVALLIGCAILYNVGSNFAAPQWSSLMGDLVPERRRGRFFARRTALASITSFSALVAAGLVLHHFDESGYLVYAYIGIFSAALMGRLVSMYHIGRMHEPGHKVAALEIDLGRDGWRRLIHSPFARFAIFFALMQFSVAIASPFFTVYMLRDLGFTYMEYMANIAASVLVQFFFLSTWGRLGDTFGNRAILAATGFCIPLLPFMWLFTESFWVLLLVQAFSGLVWAGYSLSAGNFLYDLIPADKRATYMSFHSLLATTGLFLGASLGGYLGTVLPTEIDLGGEPWSWSSALLGVMVISGIARMSVAMLFIPRISEVRSVRPISAGGVIFKVTRINALSGLIFDIIGSWRRPGVRRQR